MTTIEFINESTVVSDDQLKPIIDALQIQVSRDFAPLWGCDAKLEQVPKGQAGDPAKWWMVILDNSDQADALGYHDLTPAGMPQGKVFAESDIHAGSSLSVTISHEVLETLGDPTINSLAMNDAGTMVYCLEACDACEEDALGYQINGIQLSDFCTKAWWCDAAGAAGPYDFCNHIQHPFQVLPGGYIGFLDLTKPNQGWQEITADGHDVSARKPVGSRFERRKRLRATGELRRSQLDGR